ncbi:sulfotransferase family 2 domain-containing protein [Marinomonas sp. GJ51-6]|uniref:sulfotransferase family 2 domain-containing protein n=1 Tax=Marinomonas sp. GJ51-6 TaxID=2992802 RepID=UPI002934A7F5|nr:sulfotransferase family 2 domain-containing protein [Marinomonas sp. GJ51-6]WOD06176.1 sulfotransferase family 2 domain-containing protein [Marinomonas sp. GJ51-6]
MDNKKILFLHTPKVAGSSMNASPLAKRVDYKIHSFKGDIFDKVKELGAESAFKYGFVRDPFSRFVSLYNYFYKMTEEHPFHRYNAPIVNVVRQYHDINAFCEAFESLRLKGNFHFRPQVGYFTSENDEYEVDFIGKYENLQSDFNQLCELLAIDQFELPVANSSGRVKDFMQLFTHESQKVIESFYRDDFNFFNYG